MSMPPSVVLVKEGNKVTAAAITATAAAASGTADQCAVRPGLPEARE